MIGRVAQPGGSGHVCPTQHSSALWLGCYEARPRSLSKRRLERGFLSCAQQNIWNLRTFLENYNHMYLLQISEEGKQTSLSSQHVVVLKYASVSSMEQPKTWSCHLQSHSTCWSQSLGPTLFSQGVYMEIVMNQSWGFLSLIQKESWERQRDLGRDLWE